MTNDHEQTGPMDVSARYFLATLEPVSRQELVAFVLGRGGQVPPNEAYDAGFSPTTPLGNVAITWVTDARARSVWRKDRFVHTKRGAQASREAHDTAARIAESLGGPPHDFVSVYVADDRESQGLAVAFVEAFAERWAPCVLETGFTADVAEEGKKVWTMDDVLSFARTHHRLPTIRQDVENWFAFFLEKHRAEQAVDVAGGG